MNKQIYYENSSRGTPDFPVELYNVDSLHPAYVMQSHWHKDYEIIYILEGEFDLVLNDREYVLKAGDSIVVSGGILHSGTPKACKYQCLVFPPSVLYGAKKCELVMKSQIDASKILRKDDIIAHLFKIVAEGNPGYEFSVISDIYALFGRIYATRPSRKIINDSRIDKIKNVISYIDKNYADEIKLDNLSELCNMRSAYFCRFFKSMTHETPMEYVINYRIERACSSLMLGVSVIDTAYSCGFNDLSFFIKTFKKRMGITPKQYQINELKKA